MYFFTWKFLILFPLPIIHQRTTSVFSDAYLLSVYVYVQAPVHTQISEDSTSLLPCLRKDLCFLLCMPDYLTSELPGILSATHLISQWDDMEHRLCAIVRGFICALGIQSPIVLLIWQALYMLSYFACPTFSGFLTK